MGDLIKAKLAALKECIRRKNIEIVGEEYKALLKNELYREVLRELLLKELGIEHLDELDIKEIDTIKAIQALIKASQDINLEIKKDLLSFFANYISVLTKSSISLPKLKDINKTYEELRKECEKLEEAEKNELKSQFYFEKISHDTREEIEKLLEETRAKRMPARRLSKLIKKIDKEMDYYAEVESSNLPQEIKNSIIEYTVTIIGQYVRDIEEIQPLEQALPMWVLGDSARTAKLLSTKGLRHEVLYFHQETFQRKLREDILPAQQDFKTLKTVNKLLQYPKVLETLARNKGTDFKHEIQFLCNHLGLIFMRLGRLDEALEFYRKAIEIFMDNASDTELTGKANLIHNISDAHMERGEIEAAIQLAAELVGKKNIMHNIADMYRERGETEAEIQLAAELIGRTNIMHNIADIYRERGEIEAAIKIMKEIIDIRSRLLGRTNKSVLSAINDLGVAYSEAGESEKAEKCYRKVLQYGDSTTAKANLAIQLADKGEYSEAINLLKDAIKELESKAGNRLDGLLTYYFNLCSIYAEISRFAELEECYGRISALFDKEIGSLKAEYGRKYPQMLVKLHKGKAVLDLLTNRYTRAISNYAEAIEICKMERVKGGLLANLYQEMSVCLIYIGKRQEAIDHLTQAQEIYKDLGMEETIGYAFVLNSFGLAYSKTDASKSLLYYEKSLDILTRIAAPVKDRAILHNNLFIYYNNEQNFIKAEKHMSECLKLNEEAYRSSGDNIELVKSYMNGAVYNLSLIKAERLENNSEHFQIAEKYLNKARDMSLRLYPGETNTIFFSILGTFGTLYKFQEHYDVAAQHSAKAIEIFKNNPSDIDVKKALSCYDDLLYCYDKQEGWMKLRELSKEALSIASKLNNKKQCHAICIYRYDTAGKLEYYSEAAEFLKHSISYLAEEDILLRSVQYFRLGEMQQLQARYTIGNNYDSNHAAIWYQKANLSFSEAIKLASQLPSTSQEVQEILLDGPKKAQGCLECHYMYSRGFTVPHRGDDHRDINQIMLSQIISRIFSQYAMLLPEKEDALKESMNAVFKLPSNYKKEQIELAIAEHFGINSINIESKGKFYFFRLPVMVVQTHYEAVLRSSRNAG